MESAKAYATSILNEGHYFKGCDGTRQFRCTEVM